MATTITITTQLVFRKAVATLRRSNALKLLITLFNQLLAAVVIDSLVFTKRRTVHESNRLRVIPHFSSGIVERAKRERA